MSNVRIVDLPDLGAVTDAVSLVAENAGSGRVAATALRDYIDAGLAGALATGAALATETTARIAGDAARLPLAGGAIINAGTFTPGGMFDTVRIEVGGASTLTEFQWSHPAPMTSAEALGVAMTVPPTTTAYGANAIGAYVQNQSTIAAGAIGIYSYMRNTVAGATVYALNPLVTDQTNVGTAGVASTVVGAEFDIGAFNVATKAYGINMIGVFPNGTPATSIAFQVAALDPAPWSYGLNIPDRSATIAINLGSLALTANSNGQPINMTARDATNTARIVAIQATPNAAGADITLTTPTGSVRSSANLSVGGVLTVGAGAAITGSVSVSSGFAANGNIPSAKIVVSGSRGGNAALASLLTAMATYGFITDSTTA